jgi:hypothetical protein
MREFKNTFEIFGHNDVFEAADLTDAAVGLIGDGDLFYRLPDGRYEIDAPVLMTGNANEIDWCQRVYNAAEILDSDAENCGKNPPRAIGFGELAEFVTEAFEEVDNG